MINAVIVDDENHIIKALSRQLHKHGEINVVGSFTKPLEALAQIPNIRPDVVFLDVEMPQMNGIELATELLKFEEDLDIVFVTAYDRYAVEAFEVRALNYILKPAHPNSIKKTVDRIKKSRRGYLYGDCKNKIELLGGIKVLGQDGTTPVKWITSKAEELFALLLVNQKFGINKWTIIEMLWGEFELKKSEQNLYTTVFRMKKSLKDVGINAEIENDRGTYNLKIEKIPCDIIEFENFMNKKLKISKKSIFEYERILSLYKGDLFGDRAYTWAIPIREKYFDIYVENVKNLVKYYIEQNQYKRAAKLLKTLSDSEHDIELLELKEIVGRY